MMKTSRLHLLAALVLLPTAVFALDEVTILPSRKKLHEDKKRLDSSSSEKTKEITYCVKVTSRAFKELQNVTVKYNVFYEDVELGSKDEAAVKVIAGSETLSSLLISKPVEFETKSLELKQESLDAGWHFTDGARASAKDKVVGLWFKAFNAEGQQIGEYANPTTVPKKMKWKE